MLAAVEAVAAGLDADRSRRRVSSRNGWNRPMAFEPPPMQATSVSGSRPSASMHLLARLVADHRLEVAHHRRIGMRAGGRADAGRRCRRHWSTQSRSASFMASLSVAEPDCHRPHLGAEQLHAEDVGLLPLDVGRAHVDDAGQAEARADRRGGDAVLAGAGLGDDARLAHALGQQDLAEQLLILCAPVWLSSSRLK